MTDTGDGLKVAERGVQGQQRWSVCKREGVWRIVDRRGAWHDSAPSLERAVDEAARYSVCDKVWEAGAMVRLRRLVDEANWWQAYVAACEEWT